MRAVNLIPADSRGGARNRGPSTGMQVPVYVLLGFLAAAVALVTVYVLTNNSITARTATLSSLKTQVAQEQAAVARLGNFTKFSQLAQTRIGTVRSIAAARFDWHAALSDLSKVVPADTTLQSVVGTVVPGANSGGGSGGGTGNLRSSISAPALELTGCTRTQDDVAQLMSQLRLINGVTCVTFSNSQASNTGGSSSSGGPTQACPSGYPTFDLLVFFTPVANAGPSGVASLGASSATTTTTGGTQ
jgi:Tfp pilus assembly protein PilN